MSAERKKQNLKTEHSGRYLILWFWGIMFFIYLADRFTNWFINSIIVPFLTGTMHINEIVLGGESSFSRIRLILAVIIRYLPISHIGRIREWIFPQFYDALPVVIVAPPELSGKGGLYISLYYIAVAISLLLVVFLSLMPYLLGGILYVQIVRYKMNELLELDRQKTEEFEQKRNLLLSDIAHDIKTPITSMSGYAKALNDGLVPNEKYPDYLESIYKKSMRVSGLIDMLFEYIKLDSAGYSLERKEKDIAEILRNVVADMYQDMEDAGLEIDVDIPEEKCTYMLDDKQFPRVIFNLLSNAEKYLTAGDKVRIVLKTADNSQRDKNRYTIYIEDSGEKIEKEVAEDLFTPFTRGEKDRNTKGGTGLGLSIAKKIVELHEGTLYLDQNRNDGYTKAFVIKL